MKNAMFVLVLSLLTFNLFSQNDQYLNGMKEGISQLNTAESMEALQAVANLFERISNAEKEEFWPAYYQSYTFLQMAIKSMQADGKDIKTYVDKAQEALDKAMERGGEHSELYALQGYVYQGRIWENSMVNGAIYSPKSTKACEKAIELDPNNPRPYYLIGQNLFYTPSFFGGGPEVAKPMLAKAKAKYDAFEKADDLTPEWGEEVNNYLLAKCEEN